MEETESQREPWARYWDDHNARALAEAGPLWVALGDSVAQGIGASDPSNGYIPAVLSRLREESGEQWRVINLAMTGARIRHVVDEQLPVLQSASLVPAITTCMIGFNDFVGGTSGQTIRSGGAELIDRVPAGTLFGRVGGPRFARRTAVLADVLDKGARSGKIALFDPYGWPGATDVMARDRIHLNDNGYSYLADAVHSAIAAKDI